MRKRALILCSFFLIAVLLGGSLLVNHAWATSGKLLSLMYHHLTTDPNSINAYTILVDNFEEDLIYLRDNGYESITVAQLLAHMNEGSPLPDKPVLLTFDDGNESVYAYAFPLLQKYNMKASVAIVGAYIDLYTTTNDHNLTYSYMNWSEVEELQNSGMIEIQNHSYDLHQIGPRREGCKINPGETLTAYNEMLASDIGSLQEAIFQHTGWYPNAFVYPYGFFCEESLPVLRDLGFNVAFTCEEHWNQIPEQKSDFLLLGRFNRSGLLTTKNFFQRIL